MIRPSDDRALIDAAISDGRIPPSRRNYYLHRMLKDPAGTKALLASLSPGVVALAPVVDDKWNRSSVNSCGPVGVPPPEPLPLGDGLPPEWFGRQMAGPVMHD
jgi:hypothetical protein